MCLLIFKGHAEQLEQLFAFCVIGRRCDDGDVHPFDAVDFIVVDLREYNVLFDAQGIVAVPVQCRSLNPPEVAHAGQGYVYELVDEVVHAVFPQGHHAPDGHPRPELEGSDGFLGSGNDRLLP